MHFSRIITRLGTSQCISHALLLALGTSQCIFHALLLALGTSQWISHALLTVIEVFLAGSRDIKLFQ